MVGISWMLLFPFVIAGMILVWHDSDNRYLFIPINAQVLTLLVTTAIFYGSERFRMPYEPLLAVYAAVAVIKLKEAIQTLSIRHAK